MAQRTSGRACQATRLGPVFCAPLCPADSPHFCPLTQGSGRHASCISCPPQTAVSGVPFHQCPPPHRTPPPSPGRYCTYTGEMSAFHNNNSQPSIHTKSSLKSIKLFPSLNPKCHKTNCISAIYLEISLVLIAGTPECLSIRSG